MSITEKDKIYEESRLKDAYSKLIKRIEDLEISLNDSLIHFKKSNEQMWDNGKRSLVDFSDAIENMPYLDSIRSDFYKVETLKRAKRMLLLQRDMYFGRIDFKKSLKIKLKNIYREIQFY